MDTLACGFQALDYSACTKMLGPVVPGATFARGARILPEPLMNWIVWRHLILVLWLDGSILMILGWLQNGVIPQTTWGAF